MVSTEYLATTYSSPFRLYLATKASDLLQIFSRYLLCIQVPLESRLSMDSLSIDFAIADLWVLLMNPQSQHMLTLAVGQPRECWEVQFLALGLAEAGA